MLGKLEHNKLQPSTYSRAFVRISFRRLLFGEGLLSAWPRIAALAYSSRPTWSASAKTRVLTVAPSRRFLLRAMSYFLSKRGKKTATVTYPSLRDCAIVSANCHSFPCGTIPSVCSSRPGVHSVTSFTMVGIFESRLLERTMMPSSSKSWNAFLRVSLFTASK